MRGHTWSQWWGASLLVGLLAFQAGAATYSVARDGSNQGTGSTASPWRTIAYGARQLQPGDTLEIGPGTYPEWLKNVIPSGTSWDAPVRVTARPRPQGGYEPVMIQPRGGPSGVQGLIEWYGDRGHRFIELAGLILDGRDCAGHCNGLTVSSRSASHPSAHIRLRQLEVRSAKNQGLSIGARTTGIELLDLDVHHNGQESTDHGVYLGGRDHLIAGGQYHHNAHYGLHVYNGNAAVVSQGHVIRGVWSHHNRHGGIIAGHTTRTLWLNNVMSANRDGGLVVQSRGGHRVLSNTLWGNAGRDLVLGARAEVTLIGNLLQRVALPRGGWPSVPGAVAHHNLVGGNPLLVDPAAGDFRLRLGSPAIDAGVPRPEVLDDRRGVTRPQGQAHDLGAYEYDGDPAASGRRP